MPEEGSRHTPRIDNYSRELDKRTNNGRGNLKRWEALYMCDARSKAEFNRMREQQEAEERAKTNQECTFKPKINNKEGLERDNRENVDLFER